MNDEIRACFRDIHVFNSTVISALVMRLEKKGILKKQEVATWVTSAADQLEAMEPNQEVSAMLGIWANSWLNQRSARVGCQE